MVDTLQRTWNCIKKLVDLIELLKSDDDYDFMAGKVPPDQLKTQKREKTIFKQLWCRLKPALL